MTSDFSTTGSRRAQGPVFANSRICLPHAYRNNWCNNILARLRPWVPLRSIGNWNCTLTELQFIQVPMLCWYQMKQHKSNFCGPFPTIEALLWARQPELLLLERPPPACPAPSRSDNSRITTWWFEIAPRCLKWDLNPNYHDIAPGFEFGAKCAMLLEGGFRLTTATVMSSIAIP